MEEKFFARRRRGSWLVGFLLVVGLIAGAFVILTVGTEEGVFTQKVNLKTRMSQVNGLTPGAPVRLEGYRIGTVNEIEFVDIDGKVGLEISFNVDSKIRKYIRMNSNCSIGTLGLLGDKYLGLNSGTQDSPPVQDGAYLPASNPVDIEEVMNKGIGAFDDLKKSAENVRDITNKINTGKGTIGMLVNDPELYFDIKKMTVLLTKIEDRIENGEGLVSALFHDRALYDSLITLSGKFSCFMDTLNMGKGSFQAFVKNDSLYNNLQGTIEGLSCVIENLNKNSGSAGALLNDRELYNQTLNSLKEFNLLIKDIKENPRKYISIKIF